LIATLRYASGVIGSLELGCHLPGNFPLSWELVVECFGAEHSYHCAPGQQSVSVYGAVAGAYDWQPDPAEAIVASFAGWLRGGPRPLGSIADDLTALALSDRIREAAHAATAINLMEA